MPPCTRRSFLQTGSCVASLALAGCAGERQREETTTPDQVSTPTNESPGSSVEPTTSKSTPTATTEPEPNTPLSTPERQYRLGEWHVTDPWKLTVVEIDLSPTFQTNDGETYEMPADEQLLLVTTRIENVDTRKHHYSGAFAGLIDGEVYEDDMDFPHPDFEHGVRTKDLVEVEHIRRWSPHALPLGPDETATSWLAWSIPREIDRADVRIAHDPEGEGTYPVRWKPA